MANAQDALNELAGPDEIVINAGLAGERKTKRVREAVFALATTLTGGITGLDINKQADALTKKWSLTDIVRRTAIELTYWTPRRGPKQLVATQNEPTTMLGHAADAAAFGAVNHALLVEIAKKSGVDTAAVLARFTEVK